MGDVVSWGLINSVKKAVKKLQSTVEGLDVETPLENGLNEMQGALNTAITKIEEQVDGMEETVNNAPVGGPMPYVLDTGNFSAESVENGIKLTYKATIHEKSAWGVTVPCGSVPPYGIMIRYGTDGFPRTPNEGILAVDDTDIVDKTTKGPSNDDGLYGKTKTFTVVGLTSNTLYYFSAFPYSYDKVFNTNYGLAGTNQASNNTQRKTCQWTGTKGTLTVTITQDYDYKTLGEITVTATPTAGGDPVSASRTGAGNVSLSLDGGEYTVSFSACNYYTTPESQTIDVVAGKPNTASAEYIVIKGLSNYSWKEIKQISSDGNADKIFAIHETKLVTIGSDKFTMEIAALNYDFTSNSLSSKKIGISFLSKELVGKHNFNDTVEKIGFPGSDIDTYLNGEFYNTIEAEVRSVITPAYRWYLTTTGKNGQWYQSKIWLPRASDISFSHQYAEYETEQDMGASHFPIFTSYESRAKKYKNNPKRYYVGTIVKERYNDNEYYNQICAIAANDGEDTYTTCNSGECFCIGFCV